MRARSTIQASRRGGRTKSTGSKPIAQTGLPACVLPTEAPVPDHPTLRPDPDRDPTSIFMPRHAAVKLSCAVPALQRVRMIGAGGTRASAPEPCGYYTGMNHNRDAAVTRSEEELAVETVWRPAERVRVRRRVVEEEVMVAVTVRREELEIVREPASRFDPPRPGAGEAGEALVMALHEARPGVGLRGGGPGGGVEVVPTEVVRIRRVVVRGGERIVTDTVRREQIEVERA